MNLARKTAMRRSLAPATALQLVAATMRIITTLSILFATVSCVDDPELGEIELEARDDEGDIPEEFPPQAPDSTFRLTARSSSSVTMKWTAPPNTTATQVQRRFTGGSWVVVASWGALSGGRTYTAPGLPPDTRVCFRIAVFNQAGSDATLERCAVTGVDDSPEVRRARLEIVVADVAGADTDDWVSVSLNDTWFVNFTGVDYSHDDFERNTTFAYDLSLRNIERLHDIVTIKIQKYGTDGLCLSSFRLLVNEVPAFSRVFGNSASTCQWIDGDGGHSNIFQVTQAQLRASALFDTFPEFPPDQFIDQEEIEHRVEGAVGDMLWRGEARWGDIQGEAVEASNPYNTPNWIDLHFDLEVPLIGPDAELDVAITLEVGLVSTGGVWHLAFEPVWFELGVSDVWWADVLAALFTPGCGLATTQTCMSLLEDFLADQIEASIDLGQSFAIGSGCTSPEVVVTANADLDFSCP